MHIGLHVLQPFLVHHAEMLLLVHDHQAQPLELDAFGQERMGADNDVHRAVFQRLLGFFRFLHIHKA